MTKQEAYELLNCNGAELAEKLGITPTAVYLWPDEAIPVGRAYQINDVCWKNRMTRFGKLKKIIGVYHVKESATAVQCRVKGKCG